MSESPELHSLGNIGSLILIAGLSGAGKTTALTTCADMGYFAIDNLPVPLFPQFIELSRTTPDKFAKTVMLLDIDSHEKVQHLLNLLRQLGPQRSDVKILFLDCKTETILKRYSETRRPHPGFQPSRDHTLEDAIIRERSRLQDLKNLADFRIETSTMNVHDLRRQVRECLQQLSDEPTVALRVNFVSFGFKYGAPFDCDLIIDVRFLPNPHHVPDLREHTGLEDQVRTYVLQTPEANEFINRYSDLIGYLLPHYVYEGKAYLNIGIGCTGGKHRSVVIAEELQKRTPTDKYYLSVNHRDIERA